MDFFIREFCLFAQLVLNIGRTTQIPRGEFFIRSPGNLFLWSLPEILVIIDFDRAVIEFAHLIGFGAFEIIRELFVGRQNIDRPAGFLPEGLMNGNVDLVQLPKVPELDAVGRIRNEDAILLVDPQVLDVLLLEGDVRFHPGTFGVGFAG